MIASTASLALFFYNGPFMPHGGCYFWTSSLIALHAISDGLIVLSYYTIPLALITFVRKRKDLQFHWMFLCFAIFILACGTTHLLEIWNIWHGNYWLSGIVKAITALASVPTAILLLKLVPHALALPSPSELLRARTDLERRVEERTAELSHRTEELRTSEERLRQILDTALDAVVVMDAESRITGWSAQAEAIFGWKRAEVIGRPLTETIIPARYREAHHGGLQHYLQTGEGPVLHQRLELEALHREGHEFPIEISITPLQLPGSVSFSAFVRDITGRRESEKAAGRLAAIVESSYDAIVSKTLEGVVTSWNAGAERIFGYAADEIIGHSIAWIIPPDQQPEEEKILARIKRGEKVEHFETTRVRKDGTLIAVSVMISPITDAHGVIVGASKVARDITGRKRDEEERKQLAQLIEHSRDFIAVADLQGRITFMNRGAREMIGLRPDQDAAELHFTDYIPGEWQNFFRETVIATALRDGLWEGEMQLCNLQTGELVDVLRSTFLLREGNGEATGFATVTRDITERKRSELALVSSNERFQIVAQVTNDAVWDWDISTDQVWWNEGVTLMFGYRLENGRANPTWWSERVHPADSERVERDFQALVWGSGTLWQDEYRFRCANGMYADVLDRGMVIRDESGRATRMIGAMTDLTGRKRGERRMATQAAVSRVLSEATSLEDAAAEIVQAVCEAEGWDFGAVWVPDARDEKLAAINLWHRGNLFAQNLEAETRRITLERGRGLPGRIWQTGKPFLIRDVETDGNYPRAPFALEAGLRSALAFPIIAAGKMLGVVDFLGHDIRTADPELLEMFETLGRQIGSFVERQQAKEDLREKNAQLYAADRRLAEIVQGMSDACFALDQDWRFTFVNDRCETLLRHHRVELLGRSIWDIFRAAAEGPLRNYYERAMATRAPVAFEAYSPTAERWLDVRLFPSGPGLAAFLMDIQPRKEAEQALMQSQAEFRDLFDNAPAGYHEVDEEGRIVRINRTELKMLGYSADDLLGQSVWKIAADEKLSQRSVQEKLRGFEPPHPFERLLKRKDGSIFPVLIEDRFVWRNDGTVMGIRSVIRDITELKKAEEEIRQLNAELEQRVIQRTAQLEAANKELESFSYSVSHDLRAPLRAVDGFARAVTEDYAHLLPEEGQRYLNTIMNGAQRMGNLIDDLLTFSRLSRLPLKRQSVNMGSLVAHVLDDLQADRAGRNVEVHVGELPACLGDPALLKQVWMNLLSNAFKYSRNRDPAVIDIKGECIGELVSYTVRDNGAGFDMHYAHKLFGVFQRLHRAEDYEGTGVGLAIVQRVVHRHGGEVSATAQPDAGATFTFTLNLKEEL